LATPVWWVGGSYRLPIDWPFSRSSQIRKPEGGVSGFVPALTTVPNKSSSRLDCCNSHLPSYEIQSQASSKCLGNMD